MKFEVREQSRGEAHCFSDDTRFILWTDRTRWRTFTAKAFYKAHETPRAALFKAYRYLRNVACVAERENEKVPGFFPPPRSLAFLFRKRERRVISRRFSITSSARAIAFPLFFRANSASRVARGSRRSEGKKMLRFSHPRPCEDLRCVFSLTILAPPFRTIPSSRCEYFIAPNKIGLLHSHAVIYEELPRNYYRSPYGRISVSVHEYCDACGIRLLRLQHLVLH